MAIVTLLLCGIFALVLFFTKTNLERESLGMMQSIASDPLRPGRPGETPEGVRLPYFILELDDEGAVVSAEGGYYDLTDEDFLAALASQASGGDVTGILEDYGLRYCRVSVHGKEYIVFADMSSERNVIGSLVRDCLLIGVLSFAVFLAVSFLLARWAVRPVELAWEKQRQFVADASHELKTPLTVILSNAQLLGEDASDAATRERLTGNILSMSTRMRGLAEDLLELARVDDVPSRPCGEAFDLSRLVSEAVLPFEPLFYERGLGLESDIEPGICVRGDAEGLSRVLGISCGLYDLVSKEAIPDMSDLVSFTVETASGTLDIEYLEDSCLAYTDRYTWFSLADGEYTALDNELTEDLVSLVTGLSWGECVDYDADVKDLGDYGLDTPSVTVSVSYIETTEVETNETDEEGEPVYETREDVQAIVDTVEALLA